MSSSKKVKKKQRRNSAPGPTTNRRKHIELDSDIGWTNYAYISTDNVNHDLLGQPMDYGELRNRISSLSLSIHSIVEGIGNGLGFNRNTNLSTRHQHEQL